MEGVSTPSFFFIITNSQTILNSAPDPQNRSTEIQIRAESIVRIFVQHTRANCQNISNFQNKLFSPKRKFCLDFSAPTWYNMFGGTIFKLSEFSDYSELSEFLEFPESSEFSDYSEFATGCQIFSGSRAHTQGAAKRQLRQGAAKGAAHLLIRSVGAASQNLTKIFKFSESCVWKFDRKNQIFKIKLKELQKLDFKSQILWRTSVGSASCIQYTRRRFPRLSKFEKSRKSRYNIYVR